MKKLTRILCLVLALMFVLCACSEGTTPTTAPTTNPTEPPAPVLPQVPDFNRPLPVLAEKKVTDAPAAGDLILAEEGVAKATIVYTAGNTEVKAAADDLAAYLLKIVAAHSPSWLTTRLCRKAI